jgi:hypothetical protein
MATVKVAATRSFLALHRVVPALPTEILIARMGWYVKILALESRS